MKILILSDSFPPFHSGGAGIIAERMSVELSKMGHDVLVFSTCQNKAEEGLRMFNNIKLFFLYNQYDMKWRGWLGIYNKKVLKGLEIKLKEFKPDVVHTHNVHTYLSYASLKLAKKYCRKVFLTVHDVDSFHQDKFFNYINKNDFQIVKDFNYKLDIIEKLKQIKKTFNPFRNLMIKYYLNYVTKIFAVSNALKEALNQNGIDNIVVIYNGIDEVKEIANSKKLIEEKFGINHDKKIILMTGRFGSLKGGGLIIPYIKELKNHINNFVFVVASKKNNYTKTIYALANVENLNSYLLFTDWMDFKDLSLLYSGCDICLIPSITLDSLPNNNLEAMIFKKPVIGTCFGGTPEVIIDGVTGYIINPYDKRKTAQRIAELLINDNQASKFGLAGYQRVREYFSIERQLENFLKYYKL